jgi:hypothetical protein
MQNRPLLALCLAAQAVTVLAQGASDAVRAPVPAELLARASHSFAYDRSSLSGDGARFLREQTAGCQFVLFGEDHMDHATPIFAGALFRMLHDVHGFRHLVVEQDPVAIEEALAPAARGSADRIAALSVRWPTLFEFDTDEDLTLLADVGALVPGPGAIWGIEQATGATRYLEELVALAPNEAARNSARLLLDEARAADSGPSYSVNWLIAPRTPEALDNLARAFAASADSRAERLQGSLAKSAEIFGYYRRAEAGEFVGLYNNTVREEVLKSNFLERYRAAEAREGAPKAMFKFGANHLYHGKNPTQAFPIGNLAHEMAISRGSRAYGLFVIMLGEGYRTYQDYPAWLRTLLPAMEPHEPTLVDLRALRPYQRLLRDLVDPADLWEQRALLHGYDAVVLLPGSRPGERKLGGREHRAGGPP